MGVHRLIAALPMHHSVIGFLDPLPAVVTIQRKISPRNRNDLGVGRKCLREGRKIPKGRFRRNVAPVCNCVNGHRYTRLSNRIDRRDQMHKRAMHAPVRDKPDKMGCATCLLQLSDKRLQPFVFKIALILNRQIDLPKVHRHNAPRADIGVTDFRVAHLPARQAHIRPMSGEKIVRALR